jgi:hypothetical protein
MSKFWTGVARFFAAIFAFTFVLTAIGALLLVNVDRRLLVSATYKNALARQQVYARLPRIIAEQLVMTMNYNPCASNPLTCENVTPQFQECSKTVLGPDRYAVVSTGADQPSDAENKLLQPCIDKYGASLQTQPLSGNTSSGSPAIFKSMSAGDMETVISMLLPPQDLKTMTESILDQVFAYLNGQQDTITISLVSLKQRINSQAGLDAVIKLIRSQPACTVQQVIDMQASLTSGKGDLVLCRPPEEILSLITPLLQSQLKTAAAQIPDTRVISPQATANPTNFGPLGSGPTGGVRLAHLVMRLSPDLALFFLLLISFLAVRSPKGWLRWWGIPFFFTGLFSVGLAISASVSFEQAWLTFLASRIPAYLSLGVVTVFHDLTRVIIQTYLGGILVGGIVLFLLGLGMWIASGFIKKKSEPLPPAEPLPTAS